MDPSLLQKKSPIRLETDDKTPIEGAELLYWLYEIIVSLLAHYQNTDDDFFVIKGGKGWLRTAGRLAVIIRKPHVNYKMEFPITIVVGNTPLRIEKLTDKIRRTTTERIFLDDTESDLSYKHIDFQLKEIKKTLNCTDSDIADCLLKKMQGRPINSHFQGFEKFIDFLNALLFGVEASRNNICLGTSLMVLDLIKQNETTFKETFNRNGTGYGSYPMASQGGSDKMKSQCGLFEEGVSNRNNLISRMKMWLNAPDLTNFDYHGIHEIPIKEMCLIIKWLDTKIPFLDLMSRLDAQEAIKNEFKMFLNEWYI